jgi:fructokinase
MSSLDDDDGTIDAVLVIGEALVDIVQHGDEVISRPGGSPANVALGLARLGLPTRLHTALAPDAAGERIARHLLDAGVAIEPSSYALDRTSTAIARLDADGSATYDFDIEWRLDGQPALADASVVHAGSLGLFLDPGADVVLESLHVMRGHALISIDPNIRPALLPDRLATRERFEQFADIVDLVKLSDEDAAWLYPDASIDAVLDRLLELGVRLVAVTAGKRGALLATSGCRVAVDGVAVDVRDTIGAGDSFMAALLAGVRRAAVPLGALDSADLDRLGGYAAAAAAVTVGRVGADLPHAIDIERMQRTATIERCTTDSIGTVVW